MNSISWRATSCHVFVSTLVLSTVPPCLESKLLGKAHGPFRPTSSLLAPVSLARCRVRNAELQRGEAQSHRSHHLEASPVMMANRIWPCGLVFLLAARSMPKAIKCTGWTVKSAESLCKCMRHAMMSAQCTRHQNTWNKEMHHPIHIEKWVRCKFKCPEATPLTNQQWRENHLLLQTLSILYMSPLYRAFITSSWLHDPLVHFQLHNGLETEELGPKRASCFFCRFLGGKINSQTSALRECWERQSLGKWIQESFHSSAFWASSRTWGIFA